MRPNNKDTVGKRPPAISEICLTGGVGEMRGGGAATVFACCFSPYSGHDARPRGQTMSNYPRGTMRAAFYDRMGPARTVLMVGDLALADASTEWAVLR